MRTKILAPTISILLVFCILFAGCGKHDIIQPSREEIVGANLSLWDSSMELEIRLDMMLPDNTAVSYHSKAMTNGAMARWDGSATVYFAQKYFRQQCVTQCDATASAKQWRGKWVQSDATAPTSTVRKWLEAAKVRGVYHKLPVVPAEMDDSLDTATGKCYRITFHEETLDWKSLCDFHLDTLFGGEERLTAFSDVEVTLFIGTEDLLLDAIMVSVEHSDNGWFELTILPTPTQTELTVDLSDTKLSVGVLSEEWEIVVSESE
jgi:hypothetical protein